MQGSGERWPRWADPAIAAAVTVLALVELASAADPTPAWQYPVVVTMTGALAWRRRAPITVLAVVLGGLLVQHAAGVDPDGIYVVFALYPAFYSVGAHRPLRPATGGMLAGLVLLASGALLEDVPLGDYVFIAAIGLAFWGAGAAIRARVAAAVEAQTRARLAEERQERTAAAAVAAERGRIARELHDVVAHSVSVMVMQAGALRRMLPADQPPRSAWPRPWSAPGGRRWWSCAACSACCGTTPTRVPLAPQPGLARIPDLVESTEAAGVPVTLTMEAPPVVLSPGVDLCAYRIVQESLTNVIKHAGPASVRIAVGFPAGSVTLEVVDDGLGGPPAADHGHGLLGMQERVAVWAGWR